MGWYVKKPICFNNFKALLSIVAESIVIFAPMDQDGCCNASEADTFLSVSIDVCRNGPPEAVIIRRFTDSGFSPIRHCHIAECSESMG